MRKIYLIAKKLSHSFSPMIHKELADYSYSLKELEENELELFFKKREFDGLNVTIPYKTEVIKYLDEISPEAEKIGAVNTILNKNGKLYGYNTDYYGFSYATKNSGVDLFGKDVVIIGSGGASKPVALVCYDMGAKSVRVLSHSENKEGSVEKFYGCDVLVNATPVGMYPKTMQSPVEVSKFKNCAFVFDLIYNPSQTKLLIDSKKLNKKTVNGLSMLVSQAKMASEIFTDEKIADDKIESIIKLIENQTLNIMLIGMPGSGKTTIGRLLAEKLGREFIDTDEFISKMGTTSEEIIKEKGESVFRKIETNALSDISKESGLVISTGGGIVTTPENFDLCKQNSFVVFLKRDISLLEKTGRPLSEGENALEKLYDKRLSLYEKFCDASVENNKSPNLLAEDIINKF